MEFPKIVLFCNNVAGDLPALVCPVISFAPIPSVLITYVLITV